jgi:DNA invertase Pin-like site-specific DNA recombinase
MVAKRRKQKRQYTPEELYNPQIDLSREAYLYGRQSQKEQVVKNIQSHISQTVMLLAYTKEIVGFKDDGTTGSVTLFVENQVIDVDGTISIKNASGTWSINRRPGLKTICDAIEHGTENGREVGVVIAEFVDRLFRDEDRIDSNVFIKICKENDCYVHISSKRMTYNFANPQHAELFRLEVQMAAAYIDNHIRGTMLRRRSQAARLGGLWAGLGAIPVGYIVDRNEESKTFGKFIVYQPHAKIVIWLFERFVEVGYDLDALCDELRDKPCVFPDFEEWVDKTCATRCQLRKGANGGYMLSRRGLKYLLTNEVYIGTFRREGTVRYNNHEAIIQKDLFWSVYDRLKCVRPDGTPSPYLHLVRYSRIKGQLERQSLLQPITNADGSVYFSNSHVKGNVYGYYNVSVHRGLERYCLFSLKADDLEGMVIARMFWHLRRADIGDLKAARTERSVKKSKRLEEIARDLEVIEEELGNLRENLKKLTIESVVKETEASMARVLTRKEELGEERKSILQSVEDEALRTLEEELVDLEDLWPEKPFALKKALLKLLIRKVVIDYVTPRICRLQVEWAYSEWGTEERLLDRRHAGGREWLEPEREILREMYGTATQLEIMEALPNRTWGAICDTATNMRLRRQGRQKEMIRDPLASLSDLRFLEESGLTFDSIAIKNWNVWS